MRVAAFIVTWIVIMALGVTSSASELDREERSKGAQVLEQVIETRREVRDAGWAFLAKAAEVAKKIREERNAQNEEREHEGS